MRKLGLLIDWRLLLPATILVILGLVMLSSLNPAFFQSQLIAVIISLIAYLLFSQITLNSFRNFSLPLYIISVFFLIVVFLWGFESHGAARWITIFGVSLQFSELLKPFLLLAMASYLVNNRNTSLRTFLSLIAFLLPVMFFIYKQPDLGNTLIYGGVALLTMLIFGFPLLWFGLVLLPIVLVTPMLWGFLHDYQRQRVLTFVNPTRDPLGTSYNTIQAVIAVGSGMWVGRGLTESTQSGLRFLPERHTDFMFATFSESFGFIGGVIVLFCFTLLFYRMYRIFSLTTDSFSKIFTAGTLSLFLIHFFLNIGMNIGIVPIVCVTLPFVSFGGSSLLSNFILLGMVSSIGHRQIMSMVQIESISNVKKVVKKEAVSEKPAPKRTRTTKATAVA